MNTYAYVDGSPVIHFDPFGLEKYLTIFVDQPGKGGDKDTYEFSGLSVDVGHSFVGAIDTDKPENIIQGFYPDGDISPLTGEIEVPGKFVDDKLHKYDVKKRYLLSDVQYKNLIEFLTKPAPIYNLDTYNCTNYVESAAAAAGQSIPNSKGKWPGGGGNSPGILGELLR